MKKKMNFDHFIAAEKRPHLIMLLLAASHISKFTNLFEGFDGRKTKISVRKFFVITAMSAH